MAYGLKYQSDFYNTPPFYRLVSVKIYKEDYVEESEPIYVRTIEVKIQCNFQDLNTGVIGTGAQVVISADSADLLVYDDLLTSLEKQFKCVIEYNGSIVFQGYSICDLNERQFLPFSSITLQFTDYLRRLESIYLNAISGAAENTILMEIIQEALVTVNLDNILYINSSLFEERMDQGSTNEFMSQLYLNNYMFHSGPTEYDDGYETLNKSFLSFGLFLYQYKGMWCLERQEDVLRTDNWLQIADISDSLPLTPSSVASQRQILNKQDDDFKYVEMSQVIAYESGLKTLILRLQDKQLESFVFNDYIVENMTELDPTGNFPDPGEVAEYRKWYYHPNVTLVGNANNFRGLASYVKWMYGSSLGFSDIVYAGLYYAFEVQFPTSPEDPVVLTINYEMAADGMLPASSGVVARLRFALMVDGGPHSGDFIVYRYDYPTELYIGLPESGYECNRVDTALNPNSKFPLSASVDFNLTDVRPVHVNSQGYPSIWDELGNPTTQKFVLMIMPIAYVTEDMTTIPATQYLGDITVTLTEQKVLNKLTYYINANFERTEETDINFFDLDNVNFANGPMVMDDSSGLLEKTSMWVSTLNPTPVQLMDVFAKNKFQNYARTIHHLQGRILYDGYLKPFTILTDDNLTNESGTNLTFILQAYTWDLNNATYEIDAQEYTDEDLGFDYTQDLGAGSMDESDGTYGVMNVPTGLVAEQVALDQGYDVDWNSVLGATKYILQRRPYYDVFGQWTDSYRTIYEGANTTFIDSIQNESTPPDDLEIGYRVLAANNVMYSAYSTEVVVYFNAS